MAISENQVNASGEAYIAAPTITTGITASTTQSQGQQPLTSNINQITGCATENDVVTAPSAASLNWFTVANESGETAQMYPASGQDIGGGTNTPTTIADGVALTYKRMSDTRWLLVGSAP